jgi:hypothetical protein
MCAKNRDRFLYDGIAESFRTESMMKCTLTTINTQEATQRVIAAQLTRLTHKMIQLHLVTELYHLQLSLQAASPESFGYTVIPSYTSRFV